MTFGINTMKVRNIAIIAHVDHGKTTMVDQLFRSANMFRDNQVTDERMMDNNAIEKERGITILAKATGLQYLDYHINILDTPGHADFGGEVERIMNMVDGCLLLIDALEGPMPQTRFVLKKALEANVKPIVVINKVDRPNINLTKVVNDVLALFIELNAPEAFLDFKVVYASGLQGTCSLSPELSSQQKGFGTVFDLIISEISSPRVNPEGPLQFQPSLIDYNDFVGRIGIGIVKSGTLKIQEGYTLVRLDGSLKPVKVLKMFTFVGLNRQEQTIAQAGDIVGIAGIPDINVGETLCQNDAILPLPKITISEPTLQMTFAPNSSPFVGKSGKFVTYRQIHQRLMKESQRDVALRIETIENADALLVSGRGELHLGILIENMRREGFELEVSKPKVILKEINGTLCEPYEELVMDIPHEYLGAIMDYLSPRQGQLLHMDQGDVTTRLTYDIPTAGLIGMNTDFMTLTKGFGILSHVYKDHRPRTNYASKGHHQGVLIASETGTATTYSIENLEDRGVMFITPGTDVYEGMIVGENKYPRDLVINVVKAKALTNMRMANKELKVVLKAPRQMSLETCLAYMNEDELVEITPAAFRLRKKYLKENERKRANYQET
ncbi:MAG: translational GTPase TypA, partial [Bacilli bacterium]